MRRATVSVFLAVLVLLGSPGCGNPVHLITGADSIDDYCAALNSRREAFADLMSDVSSPVALLDAQSMFKELAGKAPDDITDDWQTLLLALQGLQRALERAGVEPSDFVDGKPPASLSKADRKVIAVAADELSSNATVAAVGAIDQEARDVCKVNLGL